jgi:hypothetical protein
MILATAHFRFAEVLDFEEDLDHAFADFALLALLARGLAPAAAFFLLRLPSIERPPPSIIFA